jgi:hypothetical protein
MLVPPALQAERFRARAGVRMLALLTPEATEAQTQSFARFLVACEAEAIELRAQCGAAERDAARAGARVRVLELSALPPPGAPGALLACTFAFIGALLWSACTGAWRREHP